MPYADQAWSGVVMELALTVAVVGAFATIGIAFLVGDYRDRGRRPPTTNYCTHPSYQPTIKHIGGGEYLCLCRFCSDMAVLEAPSKESARFQYAAHPCAAMTAPTRSHWPPPAAGVGA